MRNAEFGMSFARSKDTAIPIIPVRLAEYEGETTAGGGWYRKTEKV